jgi:hypothetical protein
MGTMGYFSAVKRSEREADQTHPVSVEFQSTFTPPYGFVAWCLTEHRDNLTTLCSPLLTVTLTRTFIIALNICTLHNKSSFLLIESKAVPVTGRGGPQNCETSRPPHFLDNPLTDGGKVVSLTRRPHFTIQEDSWYSFL